MNFIDFLMTDRQKKIKESLHHIGSGLGNYFESAMRYYYDDTLQQRASHLAHNAREIDGGLRDIFSSKKHEKENKEIVSNDDIKRILEEDYEKNIKGHVISILTSLGITDAAKIDSLATKWVKIATKFVKYAHRNNTWKKERPFEKFKPIWDEYESVLFQLIRIIL